MLSRAGFTFATYNQALTLSPFAQSPLQSEAEQTAQALFVLDGVAADGS